MNRRTFLIRTGGSLAAVACGRDNRAGSHGGAEVPEGSTQAADGSGRARAADGPPAQDAYGGLPPAADSGSAQGPDGGSAQRPDGGSSRNWQLAEGHYEGYFPLHVIYPRPDNETEGYARHRHAYPGLLYEIPIGVQFGKWPYRYELLAGPSGAFIANETLQWNGADKFVVPEGYGVVTWNVPRDAPVGPHSFRVRVYDQDHNRPRPSFVDVEWTVRVGVGQFVFLDTLRGNDAAADGSIDSPFKEISALQDSGRGANKICYIRQTALFNPSRASFSGGYAPDPTTRARPFRFGSPSEPKAYVAFPGETVHINTARHAGFAQSTAANDDVFFAGIVTAYTNQAAKNQDNVRVVASYSRSRRLTFWRMGCIRAYGGNIKDDNHGFVYFSRVEGNVAAMSGHAYLYSADCWMDEMNVDPGPAAAFGGAGANGAHLWSTYTVNRTLAERHTVTNSRIVNNAFVINKGSARDAEIRGCTCVKGNIGEFHVRTLGANSDGETERVVLCYNKTGNASNSGRVVMGQAGTNPPYRDIIAFRNSCAGAISASGNAAAMSGASNNIASAIAANVKVSSGNVEHGGRVASMFDAEMNLIGAARDSHLGKKGAEIA